MRLDGRKWDEMRPVRLVPHFTEYAEGSALIEIGKTRVLCTVSVDETVPRWMQTQGKTGGWVTAEYAMLPRATRQRTPRETMGLGGRTMEIRRMIGRSLRAALDLEKLGPRTCILDCDVIQADGGTRTAAVTGGYLALAIAVQKYIRAGVIPPDTLLSPIAAVSVGVVDGEPLLDLTYDEDSLAQVDANIVMNADGNYVEIQSTAEGPPFSRVMMNRLLDLAYKGINELLAAQRSILETI